MLTTQGGGGSSSSTHFHVRLQVSNQQITQEREKKKKNTFHFHSSNLKCWANMTTHHLHRESFLLHKICLHAHTGTCSDSKLNMYGQHLDKLLVVFFVCLFSIEPYKGLTEQQANERMRSKHGRKALWFCRPKPKTVCRKSTNRSSTK